MKQKTRTRDCFDYGDTWLGTGGTILVGAIICLIAGTIGYTGVIAAAIAAYVLLVLVGAMARADR